MSNDLLLYALAGVMGFVLALIIVSKKVSPFEQLLNDSMEAGKRVIITIGDSSYIFQKVGDQLIVKLAHIDYEMDRGEGSTDDNSDSVDSVRPDQLN